MFPTRYALVSWRTPCQDERVSVRSTSWQVSVLPVWLIVAAGVAVAFVQADRIQALAVTLIAGVLLTFLAQLATRTPAGFLDRARLSVLGVVALVTLGGLASLVVG